MGRRSHARSLGVWMNGELVGHWTLHGNGSSEFGYAPSWLSSSFQRPISLSMPLRPANDPYRDQRVTDFFDNLLPDTNRIRERIQSRFRAASTKAFDLLERIGRDCVGALQLLPGGEQPQAVRTIRGDPVSASGIERLLDESISPHPQQEGGGDDEFRISIAGAQEKTALLKVGDTWMRPNGSTPTTHILKLPIGAGNRGIDLSTSVENEWLCARILAAFGVPVAASAIRQFGARTVLEVERFDRQFADDGSWIVRLPQEDFCQATGTPGTLKYEADGGPGIERIMNILRGSVNAADDRANFLRTQILFWMLCAIDGHAKNFSIFLLPQGRFRLTPLYDVLSAFPVLGRRANQLSRKKVKMAMAVHGKNRHYTWSEIRRHHWGATAHACGLEAHIGDIIDTLVAQVPQALSTVSEQLPAGFPAQVADTIFDGITDSVRQLRR